MKSFPSTFTKNPLVQTKGMASGNIKQTLKNMAGKFMNNVLNEGSAGAVTKESLSENIEWIDYDYNTLLDNSNISNKLVLKKPPVSLIQDLNKGDLNRNMHENAFKMPASVLSAVNRYRFIFKETGVQTEELEKKGKKSLISRSEMGIAPSLFNPLYGVHLVGATRFVPLLNINEKGTADENTGNLNFNRDVEIGSYDKLGKPLDYSAIKDGKKTEWGTKDWENYKVEQKAIKIQLNNFSEDWTDCSIKKLVDLSGGYGANKGEKLDSRNTLGRAKYRYADFMYCKDLGKVSNNHLITLRKFPGPVGDNIFRIPGKTKGKYKNMELPDVGRLITWFGTDDNKLEDICRFQYKSTWKPLNAEIQTIQSKEDDGKPLTSLINAANPQYWKALANGTAGGGNTIFNWIAQKSGFMEAQGTYQNDPDYYYLDKNKVWEPKNTVRDTHTYEGKLEFNQEFTLNFSYKLRSYDGINPRSAFMDLLGNILEVTYRRGRFWGGSVRFIGPPRNNSGWQKANQILDKLEDGLETGLSEIFGAFASDDIAGSLMNVFQNFGNYLGNMLETAKNSVTNFISGGGMQEMFSSLQGKSGLIAGGLMGMLKNKLGRPAVYAMNSLLSGEPVGMWHLTIGNPRNPILSMGNLILTNAEIRHSGPLGIDDFPSELTVIITLKHAKSRDLTEISRMYTAGQGGIYVPLKEKQLEKYYKGLNIIGDAYVEEKYNSYQQEKHEYTDAEGNKKTTAYLAGQTVTPGKDGGAPEVKGEPKPIEKTRMVPSDALTLPVEYDDLLNLGWSSQEEIESKELQFHSRNS